MDLHEIKHSLSSCSNCCFSACWLTLLQLKFSWFLLSCSFVISILLSYCAFLRFAIAAAISSISCSWLYYFHTAPSVYITLLSCIIPCVVSFSLIIFLSMFYLWRYFRSLRPLNKICSAFKKKSGHARETINMAISPRSLVIFCSCFEHVCPSGYYFLQKKNENENTKFDKADYCLRTIVCQCDRAEMEWLESSRSLKCLLQWGTRRVFQC